MVSTRSTSKATTETHNKTIKHKDGAKASEVTRPKGDQRKYGKESGDGLPNNDLMTKHIRENMYNLISRTQQSSTICPSQVARALHEHHPSTYKEWRGLMDPVREVVWEDVKEGNVEVTQEGVVRPYEERNNLKGPIRVKRGPKWEDLVGDEGRDDKEEE